MRGCMKSPAWWLSRLWLRETGLPQGSVVRLTDSQLLLDGLAGKADFAPGDQPAAPQTDIRQCDWMA